MLQAIQQPRVRRREFVRFQFGGLHPFEGGATNRLWFACLQAAEEEFQVDREIWVFVRKALEDFAHMRTYAQLLLQFTRETLFV